ncbi:MAG: hypothetical protein WB816_06910 [Methylocystis sp.]
MAFESLKASWQGSTLKIFYDIVAFEAGQGMLPVSKSLMGGCIAAYAVAQTLIHLLDHELMPSLLFGVSCAALVTTGSAAVLTLYKRQDKIIQTVTALTGVGAVIAFASIILHFVFAVALPPPLPTQRLVNFLLFPMVLWMVFAFAFMYRHAGLRNIPAFAFAATCAIIIDFIFDTLMH